MSGQQDRRVEDARESKTVTLKSQNDLEVQVDDPQDAVFLRLADSFLVRSREIQRDPSRRKPRLASF